MPSSVGIGFAKLSVTSAGRLGRCAVHDDLYCRVLYLEAGDGPVLVISLDDIGLTPARSVAVKSRLARSCGIPASRIALFYSHTHAGIEPRASLLAGRLAEAVLAARSGACPAQVAYERVDVGHRYSVNRRAIVGRGLGAISIIFNRNVEVDLAAGTEEVGQQIRDFVRTGRNIWSPRYLQPKLDPGPAARDLSAKQVELLESLPAKIRLRGPVDPHLEWLAFRSEQGAWLGSIVRFSAHPVMWRKGITGMISADYPGILCQAIEQATDGPPALFVNGPCGDVKPLYRQNTEGEMNRVGRSLAQELLARRESLAWERLEQAKFVRLTERFPVHRDVLKHAGRWPHDAAAARHIALARRNADPGATKRALDWALRCWGNREVGWRRPVIVLPFHLITFNGIGLLGLPTEVWAGIGMGIKRACADRKLMVGANCDTTTNYVPKAGAMSLGGYEAMNSMLEESAGDRFVELGIELVTRSM